MSETRIPMLPFRERGRETEARGCPRQEDRGQGVESLAAVSLSITLSILDSPSFPLSVSFRSVCELDDDAHVSLVPSCLFTLVFVCLFFVFSFICRWCPGMSPFYPRFLLICVFMQLYILPRPTHHTRNDATCRFRFCRPSGGSKC